MKALLRIAILLIAATSVAGCFEPIQSGGVVIFGDPSERIRALCHFRGGDESFCGEEETPAAPAATQPAR